MKCLLSYFFTSERWWLVTLTKQIYVISYRKIQFHFPQAIKFHAVNFRMKGNGFSTCFLEKKRRSSFHKQVSHSVKYRVNLECAASQTVAVYGGRRLLALPPANADIHNSSIQIPILIKINKLQSHQCPFGSYFKNCDRSLMSNRM